MDLFKKTSEISVSSIVFGFLTLISGWMITEISNQITQIQIGEIALVFLSLFFFSLVSYRIQELEGKIIPELKEKRSKEKHVQGSTR